MRIGVISDTHGQLRPEALAAFAGVDHILHAGDIGSEDVLDQLRALAPLTAVGGNIDNFHCGGAGPEARVELGGLRFYLTHILDRPTRPRAEVLDALARESADVVVFGHSHLPHDERRDGLWFFNPASAGPRRFDYPVSVGFFERDRRGRWRSWHLGLDDRSRAVLAAGTHMNQLSRE